jgi:hypothetical protein
LIPIDLVIEKLKNDVRKVTAARPKSQSELFPAISSICYGLLSGVISPVTLPNIAPNIGHMTPWITDNRMEIHRPHFCLGFAYLNKSSTPIIFGGSVSGLLPAN